MRTAQVVHPARLEALDEQASQLCSDGWPGNPNHPAAAESVQPIYGRAARSRFLGPEHESTVRAQEVRAIITERQGDLGRAEALVRRVLDYCERTQGRLDLTTLNTLDRLAYTVSKSGPADDARRLSVETIDRMSQVYGPAHITVSFPIGALGEILHAEGDHAAIRHLWERSLREPLATPVEADSYQRERACDHGQHPRIDPGFAAGGRCLRR
jgi:hypothetical protein